MIDDINVPPAVTSDSQNRGEHEVDMEKWTRAQSAGVATAFIGHILIFGLFAIVIALSYPGVFASQLIHFLLGWAVLGIAFSAHIGTICALGAYSMFRRSTISVPMMAVIITLIFLASETGWLVVLSRVN